MNKNPIGVIHYTIYRNGEEQRREWAVFEPFWEGTDYPTPAECHKHMMRIAQYVWRVYVKPEQIYNAYYISNGLCAELTAELTNEQNNKSN